MQKVINIDGVDVKFRVSFPMFYIYKNTFGKDLLQTLVPALESIAPTLGDMLEKGSGTNSEVLTSGLNFIKHFEITDITNIIWACAKNANKDIPDVEEWLNTFETFPLVDILTELAPILIPSLFASKKLTAAAPVA